MWGHSNVATWLHDDHVIPEDCNLVIELQVLKQNCVHDNQLKCATQIQEYLRLDAQKPRYDKNNIQWRSFWLITLYPLMAT